MGAVLQAIASRAEDTSTNNMVKPLAHEVENVSDSYNEDIEEDAYAGEKYTNYIIDEDSEVDGYNAGEMPLQEDELRQEGVDATEERKIYLYSSKQKILLVGEGDFSFSKALATAFGSAAVNMVATSLDSHEEVLLNYGWLCEITLLLLKMAGVEVLHGVDATCMADDERFTSRRFDRIVYNFPHAGFAAGVNESSPSRIRAHKELLGKFFANARWLLAERGEIHVTHHVGRHPYNAWDLVGAAAKAGLLLTGLEPFYKSTFPGYVNRKGHGPSCAATFHLGHLSATYIFTLSPLL